MKLEQRQYLQTLPSTLPLSHLFLSAAHPSAEIPHFNLTSCCFSKFLLFSLRLFLYFQIQSCFSAPFFLSSSFNYHCHFHSFTHLYLMVDFFISQIMHEIKFWFQIIIIIIIYNILKIKLINQFNRSNHLSKF